MDEALRQADNIVEIEDGIAPVESDVTESSPWLELTRWPEYSRGYAFSDIASLALPPDPTAEPILSLVEDSVRRLIQLVFDSISSHRINEFDQVRINSFVHRPGVWEQPIQIKLRPPTYRRYRQIWVQLLSFVYRTSRPVQSIKLRHQFTAAQLDAVDRIEQKTRRLLQLQPTNPIKGEPHLGGRGKQRSQPAHRAR